MTLSPSLRRFSLTNLIQPEERTGLGWIIMFSHGTSETPSTTVVVENIHFFRVFFFWDFESGEAVHRNCHSISSVTLR
ncbi:hypothetical protein OIU84_023149 [Salix udensis]|uniref:Uncharacterized protein n=1 Tax=Salix udensis TaxID=889485 RepID=A0AAD6KRN4_9ROSI|nr:hypothetical protein OIU84_023149 [Salix udensis]